MKHPLHWLLSVVVIALLSAGFVYLSTATGSSSAIPSDARTPALVSGLTCLSLASGLLVLGFVLMRNRPGSAD